MILNKKIKINKNLALPVLISFLSISPLFVYFRTINITIFYLVTFVLLFLISNLNKFLFAVSVIYISISSLLICASFLQWGIEYGEFDSLIEIILYSNFNEILEYFQSYFSLINLPLLLYFITQILLLNKFLKQKANNFKTRKFFFITTLMIISILYYKTKDKVPFY